MRNQRANAKAAPPIGQAPPEAATAVASKPTPTAKHLVDVDAVLFRAANECRSDEEVRYYLNGVYVYPHPEKGVLLVATDGHRLMCVHDESGSCAKAAIVRVEPRALTGVKLPAKPDMPRTRLVVPDDGHVIVGTYRSLEPSFIDGSFPNYVLVLRPILEGLKKKQSVPASFKAEYLSAFCKISDIFKSGHQAMRIVSTGESDPALVLFAAAPEAFGILMPQRASLTDGFPLWMRPILEPAPAAPEQKKAKARASATPNRIAKKKPRHAKRRR